MREKVSVQYDMIIKLAKIRAFINDTMQAVMNENDSIISNNIETISEYLDSLVNDNDDLSYILIQEAKA